MRASCCAVTGEGCREVRGGPRLALCSQPAPDSHLLPWQGRGPSTQPDLLLQTRLVTRRLCACW